MIREQFESMAGIGISVLAEYIKYAFPNNAAIGDGMLIVGISLTVIGIWGMFGMDFFSNGIPKFRLIGLNKAALAAYQEMRRTDSDPLIELLDGSLTGGRDLRLTHIAEKIAQMGPVYGQHPPSKHIELVDKAKLGEITDDGKNSVDANGKTLFENLMIERKTFRKVMS